ncbi:MAG: AbrB/MazE/SpoVT family DNA-binding domain-containing protein [Deltaproteobacteria bacterium]|nr:AbrB/MazE/SpoVT family DNA-binding domain-containing protein [Deltaproteobacteria bacterium]
MKTRVTTRGQVSIPSRIRKKFNIEPESQVIWQTEGNTIRVIPIPKDPVSAFRGKGAGRYSTEKMIRDRQDERRKGN